MFLIVCQVLELEWHIGIGEPMQK